MEDDVHQCDEMRDLVKQAEENGTPSPTIRAMPVFTPFGVIRLPTMIVDGPEMQVSFHVDFCPYCGVELGNVIREGITKGREKQLVSSPYFEYRRRYKDSAKDSRVEPPLGEHDFKEIHDELTEIDFLLPHAKPENKPGLERRRGRLCEMLCLSQ